MNPYLSGKSIGEAIAPSLGGHGGILRCETCYWLQELGNVARHLDEGWPKHCGHTMRWWTQRQIDSGEADAAKRREPTS